MRLPGFAWYPAHLSNQTKGRERPIRKFTVHHSAGWEQTLRHLWANPDRNGSSHLYVSGTVREQYVELENTAWTNSNWVSNTESITCETRGDWRGYFDQATLNNLREAMYQALKLYPGLIMEYHCDVTDRTRPTICPCDLKNKGYATIAWNEAKNRIAVENMPKPPSVPVNLRMDIPDKKVILIRDTNVWDMSFTSFANAKAVTALKEGTVVDVAGVYDHPLSKTDYYLSNYSWNKGLNNGISKADCEDYTPPPPAPEPPVPNPAPTPVPDPAPKPDEEGPGPLPPLPTDPNGDLVKRVTAIEAFIAKLKEWFPFLN
jgi:N-acetylmuramoyl-L-alanine amidase